MSTYKAYNRANPFHDKPNISIVRLKDRSEEWQENRKRTIGASEVPTVIGKNPFSSTGIWGLWQEKAGLTIPDFKMNERMAMGLAMEDLLAQMYMFWHPYKEWWQVFERNSREDQAKNRECFNVNGIVYNNKFEWLSCNLDRIVPAGNFKSDFKEVADDHFPVEFKNIGEWVAKQYEDRIPAYYHAQAQTQMILTETHYYEFAVLIGGQHLQVSGYKPDTNLITEIVDKTGTFWYDHVLPARAIMEQAKAYIEAGDIKAHNEAVAQIYSDHEPPPEAIDEQYHNYITERHKHEYMQEQPEYVQEVFEDKELLDRFIKQKLYQTLATRADKYKDQLKYELEGYFRDNRLSVIKFPNGKASWWPMKGKDKPTFRNDVLSKNGIDIEAIDKMLDEIDVFTFINQ